MTKILPSTKENINKCAKLLEAGNILGIPTETVYGLAGNASSEETITKIYATKNRPRFNPLISHYSTFEKALKDVRVNEIATKLYERFCPGPITFILPRLENSRISRLACAGLETAAIRFPSHEVTQSLLEMIDFPVVAPSANRSSELSSVTAKQVSIAFGNLLEYVLDGGQCTVGIESTILDLSTDNPTILRHGAITKEMIEEVLKTEISNYKESTIKSPGLLTKHYTPKCGLRLGIENPIENEALLTFGNEPKNHGFTIVKNLSPSGDLKEAAKNLFNYLHELELMKISKIATTLVPEEGIGVAINDKLRRAASKS